VIGLHAGQTRTLPRVKAGRQRQLQAPFSRELSSPKGERVAPARAAQDRRSGGWHGPQQCIRGNPRPRGGSHKGALWCRRMVSWAPCGNMWLAFPDDGIPSMLAAIVAPVSAMRCRRSA